MKYFNFKRYNFSTISKYIKGILRNSLKIFGLINFNKYNYKKALNYFDFEKLGLQKVTKLFDIRVFRINNIKKIKIFNTKYFLFHFPVAIIFFGFLYLLIPTFYNYDNSFLKNSICMNKSVECIAKGKINYRFFPTPRIKIKDIIVKEKTKKEKVLAIIHEAVFKISYKNLLASDKHKLKSIEIKNFEINLDAKNLKKYINFLESKKNIPIYFSKGKVVLFDKNNYVSTIKNTFFKLNTSEKLKQIKLTGEFLNDDLNLDFSSKKIDDDKISTDFMFKMKKLNFITKGDLIYSKTQKKYDGNLLLKQNKNKLTAIVNFKDNNLVISKSNLRNPFLEGKLSGIINFLPYFNFDLDLNLNSINFTKLYNNFLSLDDYKKIRLFKFNNKINGSLDLSSEKIYSGYNLAKSLEAKIQLNNGNLLIERFLLNFGKLGASDLIGEINNEKKFTNFKFESNIFVDNEKKFKSKFGIYTKDSISSNFFISGNFDLDNKRAAFYEISSENKLSNDDINFIEKEFNDYMFDDDFKSLFLFSKFKNFIKSITEDAN